MFLGVATMHKLAVFSRVPCLMDLHEDMDASPVRGSPQPTGSILLFFLTGGLGDFLNNKDIAGDSSRVKNHNYNHDYHLQCGGIYLSTKLTQIHYLLCEGPISV